MSAEKRLIDALQRIQKEASKNKPDADRIHDIATAALEYEARSHP